MTDKQRVEILREFLTGIAYCPCCEQTEVCFESCTYIDDSKESQHQQYQLMVEARKALKATA